MKHLYVCQFYFPFICSYDIITWLRFHWKGGVLLNRLVLASCSPRRSELLHRLGLHFITDAVDVDETCSLSAPEAVEILSLRKAESAFHKHPGSFILSADTLVSFRGESFGKPKDEHDAARMLKLLSGNTHQVYTGITVISPDGKSFTAHDCSNVTFDILTDEEIMHYIRSGEPMDKAGSYAIQGRAALWIRHIDGCPSSVVGLSLPLVRSLLLQCGYPLYAELEKQD